MSRASIVLQNGLRGHGIPKLLGRSALHEKSHAVTGIGMAYTVPCVVVKPKTPIARALSRAAREAAALWRRSAAET